MPRPFTAVERRAVAEKLRRAARDSLAHGGVRQMSVEILTRAAGISKGAFYRFHPTKEALVFEILAEAETEVRRELERCLEQPWASPRELIERFLRFQFEVIDREPILALLADPVEAALLLRAVPPEQLARLEQEDDRYFSRIFARWHEQGIIAAVPSRVLTGLPRVALALVRQRDLIGRERFSLVVDLLVESLARRLATDRPPGSAPPAL